MRSFPPAFSVGEGLPVPGSHPRIQGVVEDRMRERKKPDPGFPGSGFFCFFVFSVVSVPLWQAPLPVLSLGDRNVSEDGFKIGLRG